MKMKELCKGTEGLPNTEFVVSTLCMIYAWLHFQCIILQATSLHSPSLSFWCLYLDWDKYASFIFMCLLVMFKFCYVKCLYKYFVIFIWSFVFLLLFVRILYISGFKAFIRYMYWKYCLLVFVFSFFFLSFFFLSQYLLKRRHF